MVEGPTRSESQETGAGVGLGVSDSPSPFPSRYTPPPSPRGHDEHEHCVAVLSNQSRLEQSLRTGRHLDSLANEMNVKASPTVQ